MLEKTVAFLVPFVLASALVAKERATPALLHKALEWDGSNPLEVPPVGAWRVVFVAPSVIEIRVITTKAKGKPLEVWDFVRGSEVRLPSPKDFVVRSRRGVLGVKEVGFRRRVLYAPYGSRDLRIDNRLFLVLSTPALPSEEVVVENSKGNCFLGMKLKATLDPNREGPAIHANQVGFVPAFPKKVYVGYYLGTLGELEIPQGSRFELIRVKDGAKVFSGRLKRRNDVGFEDMVLPYRQVYEADFSGLRESGIYRIRVEGLGSSYPIVIHEGVAAAVARAYALGLYHQRCGAENALPFTRFTHGACHIASAEVPGPDHPGVNRHLAGFQKGVEKGVPVIDHLSKALYPFVRKGRVDVSGGHHDAGDYSKYTINSAAMIHALVLAADAFEGLCDLDNLGIPESGNGVSDLLDIARWEARFLAKMQDEDGGFYFLVYPRDRPYEANVLPDQGDPQVVFPKNTAATAAAVAALAQIGSSPLMRRAFPEEADAFLEAARKGWAFLEEAWRKYGRAGAYQRITHYGDAFRDEDEIVWAAMELALATGEERYLEHVRSFDPQDRRYWRYGWQRMFEGFGNATRSCALSPRTGRHPLPEELVRRCQKEVLGYARALEECSSRHAYGVSLHSEYKRHRTAGWHFSHEYLFDLAVAGVLEWDQRLLSTMVSDLDYPLGANPNSVSYVTGLGLHRLRDLVSAYALNDHRILPPSGIPIGDLVPGYGWLEGYENERGELSFPPDDDPKDPYPFYDRLADSWNTQAEATVVTLARSLAGAAFLMAKTATRFQPYKSIAAKIDGPDLVVPGKVASFHLVMDVAPEDALVLWDCPGYGVFLGPNLTLVPSKKGKIILEVEALWPDGRRAFATKTVWAQD